METASQKVEGVVGGAAIYFSYAASFFSRVNMVGVAGQDFPRETLDDLTTRGVDIDVEGLPALLKSDASYIGVIGSRKRWVTTSRKLEEMGVSAEDLDRVHSPIGLEIHAETPEEIAVSIISEIIMIQRGGDGKSMRLGMSTSQD